MRVALSISTQPGTGIARYAQELVSALADSRGREISLTTFAVGLRDPRPAWLPGGVVYRSSRLPGRVQFALVRRARIPVELLLGMRGVEVVHAHEPLLFPSRVPRVVTVLDVAWRHFGEAYLTVTDRGWLARAEDAIRSADHVCAISQTTANDLTAGGFPADRITVTPLGVDARFASVDDSAIASVRLKYSLPNEFILYVGALNVRKNVGVLVRALRECRDLPPLVMVGPPPAPDADWGLAEVGALHLGYVPDDAIPALYAAARVVVFPSLLEGFGLPLLEAMAAGVPVVASDIPVFREVGGEVPMYFDPHDAGSLCTALRRLFADPDSRADLTARGRNRASRFSWPLCAERTLAAYDTVVRHGSRGKL